MTAASSDERDETQAAAATRTRQHVEREDAPHQFRPRLAARAPPRLWRGGEAVVIHRIDGRGTLS